MREDRRSALIRELKIVRKSGLHRLREHLGELVELRAMAVEVHGGETADDVESLLRGAFNKKSEGAQGTAIGILLGMELGRRGASPSVLRQVAAERLGYQSVDTFRKRPEANAIATFADVLESYVRDISNEPDVEGAKLERVMSLIEELTLAEYGEMVRRLRRRMATLTSDAGPSSSYWEKGGKLFGINR
ncbi:MAG: hypothetical protein WA972_12820 [Rhodococcus qingshengii]